MVRRSFMAGLLALLGARKLGASERISNSPANGPDFSEITSRAQAIRLAERGVLAPMLLLPELFGGDASEANVVFVPPFVVELKTRADENVIRPLAAEGRVTRYDATPRYSGRSFVPVAVTIRAFDPGDFTETIRIWGEGLVD